jgi:hypothetical protein
MTLQGRRINHDHRAGRYQHESEHLEELYIDNELSDVPLHHQENGKTEQKKTTENTERARAAAQQLQQKCRPGK